MSKSARTPPQISFYKGFFENLKGIETSLQAKFFIKLFFFLFFFLQYYINWPNTFQVIQWNAFHVSCPGILWRHDFWIRGKLKFHFLLTEKSFWSKIKIIVLKVLVLQMLSFRLTKQTSKNVVDTTFKDELLTKNKCLQSKIFKVFPSCQNELVKAKVFTYG